MKNKFNENEWLSTVFLARSMLDLDANPEFEMGKPGKSEFPADWSDEKIEGEISDIATDPATEWTEPDVRGYIETSSIRDGVEIKVVFNKKLGRVVTAYPLNRERNE